MSYKKILILGDAGRGKTTFAEKLSKKLALPHYQTDDYFWKVKFTEPNDREQSVVDINKIYDTDEWIMDGTTRRLIQKGLEKADVIFLLKFKNILPQYYFLIKRSLTRDNENFVDLWNLLKHVTKKRYKKGYGSHLPPLEELVKVYNQKVIQLSSMKDIHKYVSSLK